MIAALYARKSTDQGDRDDKEKSITRQTDHAAAYAARKGWTVAADHVYVDDAISGAIFGEKRPGLYRLLNALKPRPPFQVLVIMDQSRLGREQDEVPVVLRRLAQAGVRVFCYLTDTEIRRETAVEKFQSNAVAFVDEMAREQARQRTHDALRRKAEAGHVTGGTVFGYANVAVLTPNGKRAHVERRIMPAEAAVVRRIFELTASGASARRIALTLNAEGAVAPAPRRRGRPRAWAPSSIRAVLTRPLYRGEVLWNRSRKCNAWGSRKPQRRGAAEWIRCEVPELRIIDEPLWQAVARQRAATRAAYVRTTDGRLHGRPPSGVESKYLLTGLATCGLCGGSLVVMSRTSGDERRFAYRCQHAYYRGPTVCENRRVLPMLDTNQTVLRELEQALLTPAAVEAIVHTALAAMRPAVETASPRRAALRADLAVCEAELARLTAAIAQAPDLGSLLEALRAKEHRRAELQAELATLDGLGRVRTIDPAVLTPMILAKLDDWSGLMGRKVAQARLILRQLLVGRINFLPQADGTTAFVGHASIGPLLAGTVGDGLRKVDVSPRGFEPVPEDWRHWRLSRT
jgi:site-specific DNA recombinase